MKHRIRRLYILLAVVSMMSFICFCYTAAAAGATVQSTVYTQVIKSGKNAYCNCAKGICKVNLKTGKVTWLLKIPKSGISLMGYNYMQKKGNYLYYECLGSTELTTTVNRINLKTKKNQVLASSSGMDAKRPYHIDSYAIKGSKLYVSGYKTIYNEGAEDDYDDYDDDDDDDDYDDDEELPFSWVMNLDGKSKKNTSIGARFKLKKSNKKGYSVVQKGKIYESGDSAKWYLKKPHGKRIYLGKAKVG